MTKRKPVTTKAFMNYLKYWRLNRGLTQQAIARKLGISQGAYCDYERGFRKPGPKVHLKLAEAIDRPVEELTTKLYRIGGESMSVEAYQRSRSKAR